MIARQVIFFREPAVVICDARCNKAWGINGGRPKIELSADPDDYAYLADDEVGEAPVDPGTYEGGYAKPREPSERLNKWCVRECERCSMSRAGRANEIIAVRDFSRRLYNIPTSDPMNAASAMEAAEGGRDPSGLDPKDESAVGGNAETPSPTPAPLPMEDRDVPDASTRHRSAVEGLARA